MRTRIVTVLTVVCLLLGVMVAGVMATTDEAARANGGVTRFEVIVVANPETEAYYDWGWTLYEEIRTTDGEHLGLGGGPCFNLSPDSEILEDAVCDLGMRFPDGTITVNGAINLTEWAAGETVMAVTGGTGKFAHVSGEVAIIPAEDFTYSRVIFYLRNAKARY